MDAELRLVRIAERQHGVFTRADALSAGLSPHQVMRRVRSGRWERVFPCVYRIVGLPLTEVGRTMAAALAYPGAASHVSAAALLGLLPFPSVPEVTTHLPLGHHRRPVRLHRTDDLASGDVTVVQRVACTSATRTCIDLGARLSVGRLERVVDKAVHLELTTVDQLSRRFTQLARRGRDGTSVMRTVLELLDPSSAPAESDLETILAKVLRDGGLPAPVRQFEAVVGGRRVRLDFAYPEKKIAIESDGFAVHGLRAAFEDDRERQNLLVLEGWVVLRFTWRQICNQPDWVVEQVRRALRAANFA